MDDGTVSGSADIHSDTLAVERSAPAAAARTRSRSVRMPMARSLSSVTMAEPTLPPARCNMRAQVSATVSDVDAVRTSVVITSATVRAGRFDASAIGTLFLGRQPGLGATRCPVAAVGLASVIIRRLVAGQIREGSGQQDGARHARQAARDDRHPGGGEGGDGARLGVAQPGAAGDDGDVDAGQAAP